MLVRDAFTAMDRPDARAMQLNKLRTRICSLEAGDTDTQNQLDGLNGRIDAIGGGGGGSNDSSSAVMAVDLAEAMPVCVDRSTGKFIRAVASTKTSAFVAGLLAAATTTGFIGTAMRGLVTLTDWSAVTGSVSLQRGQTYFLAASGGLTPNPPSSPNCVVVVGIAMSSTSLLVEPELPVQL